MARFNFDNWEFIYLSDVSDTPVQLYTAFCSNVPELTLKVSIGLPLD